jgi:hypothetical protein
MWLSPPAQNPLVYNTSPAWGKYKRRDNRN